MADPEAQLAEIITNFVEGDNALSEAVAKHPEEPTAYVARARFRHQSISMIGHGPLAQTIDAAVARAIGVDFARGAIADYARILEISSLIPEEHAVAVICEAYVNTGSLLMRLGARELARDAVTSAIDKVVATTDIGELGPRVLAAAYGIRGTAFHFEGRVAEALADYDRALAAGSEDGEILSNRGEALVTLERFEEAIADFDRAMALGHEHPLAFCGRGFAEERLGMRERAAADYATTLELDPDNEVARDGLARLKAAS